MLSWKLSVLEIPLDKELTANCPVETRTKLKELILSAVVKCGLNRVQLPLWLRQTLINGFSWYIVLGHSGQRTSVKCVEAAWSNRAGGIVHLKSPAFFFFFFQCYLTWEDISEWFHLLYDWNQFETKSWYHDSLSYLYWTFDIFCYTCINFISLREWTWCHSLFYIRWTEMVIQLSVAGKILAQVEKDAIETLMCCIVNTPYDVKFIVEVRSSVCYFSSSPYSQLSFLWNRFQTSKRNVLWVANLSALPDTCMKPMRPTGWVSALMADGHWPWLRSDRGISCEWQTY